MTSGLRPGAVPATPLAHRLAPGVVRCVIGVRHHWAMRAILHAPTQETAMVHVTASIVVRPEHAAAAQALLAAAAIATGGPMFASARKIVTFTRIDGA
jgi:hypothetical protein